MPKTKKWSLPISSPPPEARFKLSFKTHRFPEKDPNRGESFKSRQEKHIIKTLQRGLKMFVGFSVIILVVPVRDWREIRSRVPLVVGGRGEGAVGVAD